MIRKVWYMILVLITVYLEIMYDIMAMIVGFFAFSFVVL